jgi:hypothetical protein
MTSIAIGALLWMTLPHMTQMWLTEVLQTTTPQGKCPPCGPVQGNCPQGSVVRAYPHIAGSSG